MIWTAWKNSKHPSTGAGYGFKIDRADRDRHFNRRWAAVEIELPVRFGVVRATANVKKKSFWDPECRELISQTVGQWLLDQGYAPWPYRKPPKFEVEPSGDRRFRVKGLAG